MSRWVLEKLNKDHDVADFNCGVPALDNFLRKHALQAQSAAGSVTLVMHQGGPVLGYYTAVIGSVDFADAPTRVTKGLGRHPVPVLILARLATDRRAQKRGIGRTMLKDAMRRTVQLAEIGGCRALLIHAKDAEAKAYYLRFADFEESPTDPLHIFKLTKDIIHALRKENVPADQISPIR